MDTCICVTDSLCCTPEVKTILCVCVCIYIFDFGNENALEILKVEQALFEKNECMEYGLGKSYKRK